MSDQVPFLACIGRVRAIDGAVAHVDVKDNKSGMRFIAECPVEQLTKDGIGLGDEFEFQILQAADGGQVSSIFRRLEPKVIPDSVLKAICDEVDKALE